MWFRNRVDQPTEGNHRLDFFSLSIASPPTHHTGYLNQCITPETSVCSQTDSPVELPGSDLLPPLCDSREIIRG